MTAIFDKIHELADQVEKGSTTELDDRARACRATKEMIKDTKSLLESVRVQLSEGWHGGTGEAALTSLEAFKKNRDEQAEDLEESAKSFEVIRDALAKAQQEARNKRADADGLQTKLDSGWHGFGLRKVDLAVAWAKDKLVKAEALVLLADLERVTTTYDAVLLIEGQKLRNKTGRVWELAGSEKRSKAEIAAIMLRELPGLAALVAKNPELRNALLHGDWDKIMQNPEVAQKIYDYLGFKYVKDGGFYTTGEHSMQSYLGWRDLYDKLGRIGGMRLDDTGADGDNMEFTDPKTGKTYRLELWKGGYGFGQAFGGEVGLYTSDSPNNNGHFDAAKGDDQIKVTQQIYNKRTDEVYFTNDGQGADGTDKRHFWNLAIRTDPNVHPNELGQRATIEVQDVGMRDRMYNEMTRYAAAHPHDYLTVTKGSDHPPVLSYDWRK
ncbi:DUF4474 domain-containing protein [Amycolatopsis sp. H20-H5]|uniref:DUF4474 domain-containing protein n=1 Tax=Amycolatopsis sp. H20-H5 TaxID=3046309 RepID=UPI002DBC031A|nr:DUF4474 domain-containing protein [Amycolatopsis sp. H20-H5]MEC3980261.1 DUF4474 domain-containing protein [Amycolatopsis sp. H20-H5]